MDKVTYWRDKPLTDYSKEELIEIVEELGRMMHADFERRTRENQLLAKFRESRPKTFLERILG